MKISYDGFDWMHSCALIVLDSVGYREFKEADTPNLDGIVHREFHDAHSTSCHTPASFFSFYVGHLPYDSQSTQIFGRPSWLPLTFQKFGYRTFGWASMPYLSSFYGWGRGFDYYQEMRRPDMIQTIIGEATEAIENCDGKFFIMLNIGETHRPYDHGDKRTDWHRRKINNYNYRDKELKSEYIEYLRQTQIKAIEYVDKQLKSLFALLIERQALIIITADHGDCFGDGGLVGHGIKHHKQMFHVPLIFSLPQKA